MFEKMLIVNKLFLFYITHQLYNIKQCIVGCRM